MANRPSRRRTAPAVKPGTITAPTSSATPDTATPRRTRTPLTENETQAALNVLVANSDEHSVSPRKGVASSAVALLLQHGIAPVSGRASYLVVQLVQAGAIERIEHSHSVKVLRRTVSVDSAAGVNAPSAPAEVPADTPNVQAATPAPIVPMGTMQDAYEETIRRLNKALTTCNARTAELEAENSALRAQLETLRSAQPSEDVRSIMEQTLKD